MLHMSMGCTRGSEPRDEPYLPTCVANISTSYSCNMLTTSRRYLRNESPGPDMTVSRAVVWSIRLRHRRLPIISTPWAEECSSQDPARTRTLDCGPSPYGRLDSDVFDSPQNSGKLKINAQIIVFEELDC